jgi:hypothetical protein
VLSVAAPIWLLGLGVIPLIWWLHRLGDRDAAVPVSAAFLFYGQADETKTRHRLPKANPLWILRASVLSMLVLALTGLNLPRSPERHITVWFDDSLSMHASEAGPPRTAIAARKLGESLDEVDPETVRMRALSDHRRQFDASADTGESRVAAIARWADTHDPGSIQIPFALPPETEHWLVSDGADQRVNDWTSETAFSRRIVVGSETENSAVTALMARRALQRTTLLHAAVRVQNLGTADSKRTLNIRADDRIVLDEDVAISPGGSIYRSFRVPADTARVVARLQPDDALILDDTLQIALDGLRPVAVDLDGRCGSHFGSALSANPGLDLRASKEGKTALNVQCAPSPDPLTATPSISVHTASDYQRVTGPVQWQRTVPELSGMYLHPSWLLLNPDSARPPSDQTLMSSPDMGLSLIDMRAGAVDVFLNLTSERIVKRPEYPLLVNALVELALARPVLDPVLRVTRPPAESRIARQLESGNLPALAVIRQASIDLTPYLLFLALLLLLADVLVCLPAGTLGGWAPRGSA